MRKITSIISLFLFNLFIAFSVSAKTIEVSSQQEFNKAHSSAVSNDIILWLPGTYSDINMDIKKSNITIKAKLLGKTIFTGESMVYISGDKVTFKGFQFVGGSIGSNDVIKIGGDYNHITEINISGYTSHKYVVIKKETQYNRLSKCNFENRLNVADKNIVAIGINGDRPGFHKVEYCSFRNFEGTGGDMGVEPIRIGSSYQAEFDSKTIVEYCYFTKCSGDGELISNKSSKNVIRYNTFEDNPLAELVLRHGNDTYVYGNFFLKNKGGIRIREGSNHYIFNNYFSEIEGRSVMLNSGKQNPIKNVYIMHNTFVNTSKLHLGSNKSVLPKKVVFENNLFTHGKKASVGNASGKEVWSGNMYQGNLGIPAQKGLKKVSSTLNKNEAGFYELTNESQVLNSAEKSKIKLPAYAGLNVDTSFSLDIVKNKRPSESTLKDVGCQEFNPNTVLKPLATSNNTGPSYSTTVEKSSPKELSEVEKFKEQMHHSQVKVKKVEKQE